MFKHLTTFGKIGLVITLIGAILLMTSTVIAALKFNILYGIGVFGLFLAVIGIIMCNID